MRGNQPDPKGGITPEYKRLIDKTITPQTQGFISKAGIYTLKFVFGTSFTAGNPFAQLQLARKTLPFKALRLLGVKSIAIFTPFATGIETSVAHIIWTTQNTPPATEIVDPSAFTVQVPAGTAPTPSAFNEGVEFFCFAPLASSNPYQEAAKALITQDGFQYNFVMPQTVAVSDLLSVYTTFEYEIIQ